MLLHCGVGKDSRVPWTARGSNQSIINETSLNILWRDWCWCWSFNILVTWCKKPTHWKIPWCRERLKAGKEGDNRGREGWLASPTQWTWVWTSSRRWWRAGKPGMLQSIGSQWVEHDWATEQQPVKNCLWSPGATNSSFIFQPCSGSSPQEICHTDIWSFCLFCGQNSSY